MSAVEERSYVETARREKRAALEAAGVPAFAYRFDRSHGVAEARELYRDEMGEQGPVVSLAGRIASLRSQGKTTFLDLEDGSAKIQVYLRRDELGERYALLEQLDLDDHIGVAGRLFRTKRGELSVRPERSDSARQVAPAAAAGQDPGHGRWRRHLRRSGGSRGAVPPALCRPRRPPGGARGLPASGQGGELDPALSRRPGFPRGGDAHPAAALRRRGGSAVRDAPQRARHAALPPYRRRALPQAAARGRARAGLRDRP